MPLTNKLKEPGVSENKQKCSNTCPSEEVVRQRVQDVEGQKILLIGVTVDVVIAGDKLDLCLNSAQLLRVDSLQLLSHGLADPSAKQTIFSSWCSVLAWLNIGSKTSSKLKEKPLEGKPLKRQLLLTRKVVIDESSDGNRPISNEMFDF